LKVLYIRYNKTSRRKALKEKKEFSQYYDEVILAPTTNGKRFLKKEIKDIERLIKEKNIDKLEIKYLDEEELNKLPSDIKDIVFIYREEDITSVPKMLKNYFDILKELKNKNLNIEKDKQFFEKIFGSKSKQTYFNHMNKLVELFSPLISKKHTKEGVYFYLRDGDNLIKEILEKIDDVEVIINILSSMSDKELKNLSTATKKLIFKNREDIIYITKAVEELGEYDKEIFKEIKKAIKEKRYVDILGYEKPVFNIKGYDKEDYKNVVPLKILFMENNWYLAGVVEDIVRFFRISFIDEVILKDNFFKINKEYLKFLEEVKTPFALFNKKRKKAILKVSKDVVFYFERKEMFPYQKIINKDPNNFLIEIEYYQYLEVAPIIKKWIPHIEIIECEDDLKEKLKKELQQYLQIL